MKQVDKYRDFYRGRRLRWLFRFDVHYRCRRIKEVIQTLHIDPNNKRVLDVGFGSGHLLKSLPNSCMLYGAEISESAVEEARRDPAFSRWRKAKFFLIHENILDELPRGPFDIILSSHTLEHVPDDKQLLQSIYTRLKKGGFLFLFVPIEEPNYIPFHVRNYSMASFQNVVRNAGFDILFSEGSMHINGHIWKLITIPSRRQWAILKPVVDSIRLVTLSMIPYRLKRHLDSGLEKLGVGPRQGFLVATRSH
ncbi:class I SAM-dependent methyltransferase [candidate division KSB1 bacterium]|nr:class I SAM-dependent methyltransferase [candidate division KSB1 bacterium]NIR72078.1 class I SAM-dependent methyltransferase [candidate division KSB1 bacterium]NIS25018.1 class I SAM-dependent methyltransferase [candidate division KSB1 bacterium]NIT71928.1 class I SAM-dependent methyltransferase [candidate division KSB1 bacterium]NIU25671.1 class I SAM-dependent methyltransferase [candidate division KSB1 bacterium]